MDLTSLTDAYLARFFDQGTLSRARHVINAVESIDVVSESPTSLTATALVQGSQFTPYSVHFHAEVEQTSDWVFSACTCPVARLCKHGAAVALLLRGSNWSEPSGPARPLWQQRLDRLSGELAERALASAEGLALGLQVARRPASRWSRGAVGEFTLRPVRPGARRGWAKSGAEWSDLTGPRATQRFIPRQVEALQALHRGLHGRHAFLVAGAAPLIDDYGERLVPLLRAAVEAGVTLVPSTGVSSISLTDRPLDVTGRLARQGEELLLEMAVEHAGRRWRHDAVLPVGQPVTTLVLVDDSDIVLTDLTSPLGAAAEELLVGPPVVATAEDAEPFLSTLTPLARHLRVHTDDPSIELAAPPTPTLHLSVAWVSSTHADLAWEWTYDAMRCPMTSSDPLGGIRDPEAEALVAARLPDHLRGLERVTDGEALAFALHDLPHLRELDEVTVSEQEPPEFREVTSAPEIEFTLADQQPDHNDWLDLEVVISVDGEQAPLPDVLAAITRDEPYLVLPSGRYVSLDRPEFNRLHEAVAAAAELRDNQEGQVRVGAHDLSVWAELAELGVVDAQAAEWVERAQALRDLADVPQPEPVGLRTQLRPYQLQGFWWLAFLHQHGLGGVLADDMGLGKTLQVLALIQHARTHGVDTPFLVVAPTSVVTAWRQQSVTHAPGLRVGVVRRRTDDVAAIAAEHDVVVTSYAVLRLARPAFTTVQWAGLVIDEAHQVKNHQGKTYAAVRALHADFRLAVTGTPFENRLMELWSLLSIAAPGLYPSPKRFRDVVSTPIEKHGDARALERLHRRIKPFVLRRTKELVAADLPPKQEQVLEVELEPRHRRIYDTHLAKERQRILGLVDDFERNRIAIFSALTKLRQLALDPALVDPAHDAVGSAKVSLLADQLADITAEGHRALVFSTFTSFLTRVRQRLTDNGIPTTYLDGSTRDREAVIEAFRGGAAPVFLISLKAGGTGLTLTEADYVYVLDPWWNPAAEAQAVDRAHRIGQDKHVHVYRLVAADTIEEKVMALKARKAELFARVIDGGGASAEGISADDIRGLFD